MHNRAWLATLILGLLGCDPGEVVSVQKAPAFFYATLDGCEWTARVGPDEPLFRSARDILREIPAGTKLAVRERHIGKDTLCYAVDYQGIRGFVLGSCGRVGPSGAKCP